MKKTLLFLTLLLVITSCSGVKRSKKALYSGNYDDAIAIAIDKLQKDRNNKATQEHILILEDAFQKMTERNVQRISFLEKENNPANAREIYNLYYNLDHVQNRITPLLPLYSSTANREAKFRFADYSNSLLKAKANFAETLYTQSKTQMKRGDKLSYRAAHQTLEELENLSPNYRDAEQLLREAHYFGTDYVFVSLINSTNQIMPRRLEEELLDFNTYGLDDFWTEYHSVNRRDIDYDFEIDLQFRNISISPERVQDSQIPLEAEIADGFTYQKDREGNYMVDENGNRIKVDKFITVKGTLFETIQTKALAVDARVVYKDVKRKQNMGSHPLQTEFIFENIFAIFRGDERVLTNEDRRFLKNRFVPFPSNEQMLLDAGNDIKARLSDILRRNKLR